MAYSWKIKEVDFNVAKQLARNSHVPLVIAITLINKNITSTKQIQNFFSPNLADLYDPFLIKDMEKAVARIEKALEFQENLTIFGDYDVDGTTATSTLVLYLTEIGLDVNYYIPDRELEGYGLSKKGIDFANATDSSLIISCDCGISAIDEVEYANQCGLDVIITDHHEPSENLPNAIAILDPKRKDDTYPFKELCGAGVAYKLLQALQIKLDLPKEILQKQLDLVAIGTAADIVPILDENRIIVSEGLKKIPNTNKIGLHSLLKKSNLSNRDITVVNIVFGIAPRINAAGRLGEASSAVKMIISNDPAEAQDLANFLDKLNRRRQQIERGNINDAIMKYNNSSDIEKDKIIILSGTNWHQGVIGIVASKLKEQYNKPVVLISFTDGIGKGSARSIPGFDLFSALSECSELLENFGGHKMAAGLTIKEENYSAFVEKFKMISNKKINEKMLLPQIMVDCEISFFDINSTLIKYLNKMAPYGPGNMRPLYISRKISISGMPRIVGGNHLKFKACQNRIAISAIGWNLGKYFEMLISNKPIDIVFVVEENCWNGLKEIQLNIKDLKYSENN